MMTPNRESKRPPPTGLLSSMLLAGLLCSVTPAHAQRDLREPQSDEWYGIQAALLGGSTLANAAALAWWHPPRARMDAAFDWERGTEQNNAPVTSRISDATLFTSVLAPVGTLASRSTVAWGNALLVYGEALEGALLLNTATKKGVARARPYTHNPEAYQLVETKGADSYYSFYSGHSALSFTSATTGSFLFAALHEDRGLRTAHWAAAFSFASFTAHARVRAGRHYPTDVLVGSTVGIAWGLALPLLHDIRPQLAPVEWVGASGGLAAGTLLAALLPRRLGPSLASIEPRMQLVPGGAIIAVTSTPP